ncbi:TRAP transporter large permease subunit [Chloroflexota bacterium]
MSPEFTIILLFALLLAGIAMGAPIAFVLGGLGVAFTYFLWGPGALYSIASVTFGKMVNYFLAAIPLFVFMAMMLERSGVADDLYTMMHRWLGPLRGGPGDRNYINMHGCCRNVRNHRRRGRHHGAHCPAGHAQA